MTRNIAAQKLINANVVKPIIVDLDAQSTIAELGAVPVSLSDTVTVSESGDSLIHKTVLTCTALPITIADDAGVAQYGGVLVYTFPEGLISSMGAIVSGDLTLGTTGTIINAFTGVNSLGTVTASTGATLVSTEATWLQSTANGVASTKVAAISSVSVATDLTETANRIVDGTSISAEVYLNFAIADDVTHTAGSGTFTGTITFAWLKVGDK